MNDVEKVVQEYFSEFELLSQTGQDDKAYHALLALITQQCNQARIDELKAVRSSHSEYYSDITDDANTITDLAMHQYDYIDDRIAELAQAKETEK